MAVFFRISGMRKRCLVWQDSGIASRSAPFALAAASTTPWYAIKRSGVRTSAETQSRFFRGRFRCRYSSEASNLRQ